jgi:hypothetical protein
MAITDSVRKAIKEATPLYAAAGTIDYAAEKLREVQPMIEKIRAQAPERIDKVRATDPKVVQDRVAKQAKDVQAKLNEAVSGVEVDLRKFRDTAQDFTLQQVGRVAEYAVKAGETYDGLVVRGRDAVKGWRGEAADQVQDVAAAIEGQDTGLAAADGPAAKKPAPAKKTPPKS